MGVNVTFYNIEPTCSICKKPITVDRAGMIIHGKVNENTGYVHLLCDWIFIRSSHKMEKRAIEKSIFTKAEILAIKLQNL